MNNKKSFFASKAGVIVLSAVLYIILFVAFMLIINKMESEALAAVICLVCAVVGWKTLNKIRPDVFLILPIVGWVVFFVFKGFLSALIGVFVAPYYVAKKISLLIAKKMGE